MDCGIVYIVWKKSIRDGTLLKHYAFIDKMQILVFDVKFKIEQSYIGIERG